MTHAGQPGALARPFAAGYKQGGIGAPDDPARPKKSKGGRHESRTSKVIGREGAAQGGGQAEARNPSFHRRQVRLVEEGQDLPDHQPGDRRRDRGSRARRCQRRRRGGEGRAQGVQVRRLVAHGAARPHGHRLQVRQADRGQRARVRAARHHRHGQADQRDAEHRHPRRGDDLQLFRRNDRQDRGPGHGDRGDRVPLHPAPAARRRRLHRAVELSADDGLVEVRAGAVRRQLGDPEAGRAVAARRPT